MERVTSDGDFSPVGGDEFVVMQSIDRVGIQNCRKGSKRSKKENLRREIQKRLWKRRTLEEKSLRSLRKI